MWCVHHRLIYYAPHVQAAKSRAEAKLGPGRPRRDNLPAEDQALLESIIGTGDDDDDEEEVVAP